MEFVRVSISAIWESSRKGGPYWEENLAGGRPLQGGGGKALTESRRRPCGLVGKHSTTIESGNEARTGWDIRGFTWLPSWSPSLRTSEAPT